MLRLLWGEEILSVVRDSSIYLRGFLALLERLSRKEDILEKVEMSREIDALRLEHTLQKKQKL